MSNLQCAISYVVTGLLALALTACTPPKKSGEGDSETSEVSIVSGDIVVSSSGTRDVKVFDSSGVYKGTILDLDSTTGQAPYGLTYNFLTNEILVAVDSATSRLIKAIGITSLDVRDFSASPAFNNSLRGITMLTSGDLLVVISAGNRVEKISGITGTQITAGAWPKSLQTGGTGIAARSAGTFAHCSSTLDVVRLYDATGTQTATAASGIAATTDVMDCKSDSVGNIYTSFNGTTDTIRKYSSDLGTTTWSYSNTVLMPNPFGIAVRANGNVLVLDQTHNYILEVAADGTSASIVGNDTDNMLSTPQFIMIVP